jgi:hypothetical protein
MTKKMIFKRQVWTMTDGQLNALHDELTDGVEAYGDSKLGDQCAAELGWLNEVISDMIEIERADLYAAETRAGA